MSSSSSTHNLWQPRTSPPRPAMLFTPSPPSSPTSAPESPKRRQDRLSKMKNQLQILVARLDMDVTAKLVTDPLFSQWEDMVSQMLTSTSLHLDAGHQCPPPEGLCTTKHRRLERDCRADADAKNKAKGTRAPPKWRRNRYSSGSEGAETGAAAIAESSGGVAAGPSGWGRGRGRGQGRGRGKAS
ncbi:hypothetical protein C8F01DRAFT_1254099 [Mycena amicta]|nr:hypothetical protein C8F01DRAFT_1254099 [Mycena amicta]